MGKQSTKPDKTHDRRKESQTRTKKNNGSNSLVGKEMYTQDKNKK